MRYIIPLLVVITMFSCKKDDDNTTSNQSTSSYKLVSAVSDVPLDVDSSGVFDVTDVLQSSGVTSTLTINTTDMTISGDFVGYNSSSSSAGNDARCTFELTTSYESGIGIQIDEPYIYLLSLGYYTYSADKSQITQLMADNTYTRDSNGDIQSVTAIITLTYDRQ